MVTMVGNQTDFGDALVDLVELDYDAVEAYDAAINRLNNAEYQSKMSEFKKDHLQHIEEVSSLLRAHDMQAPSGPSIGKQWLTKGKVVLANLIGDDMILSAMLSNEADTNTAYERMNAREDKWQDAIDILHTALQDERRHKAWLESMGKSE